MTAGLFFECGHCFGTLRIGTAIFSVDVWTLRGLGARWSTDDREEGDID